MENNLTRVTFQRRRKLRSNPDDESDTQIHRRSHVVTAGHLQVLLRDQRFVLSVRRAKLLHDVRLVDVQRTSGSPRALCFPV